MPELTKGAPRGGVFPRVHLVDVQKSASLRTGARSASTRVHDGTVNVECSLERVESMERESGGSSEDLEIQTYIIHRPKFKKKTHLVDDILANVWKLGTDKESLLEN